MTHKIVSQRNQLACALRSSGFDGIRKHILMLWAKGLPTATRTPAEIVDALHHLLVQQSVIEGCIAILMVDGYLERVNPDDAAEMRGIEPTLRLSRRGRKRVHKMKKERLRLI